jgi:hypothetical protein
MRQNRGSIAPCIQNGDEQAYGTARPLGHHGSLQLSCAQLSLEIEERPLDLHRNHPSRAIEQHINGPPVRRRAHGHLQLHPPGWRCCRPDRLGDLQLPRVAQADTIGRIEADHEIMAGGRREPMHDVEARHHPSTLSLADQCLADAGSQSHLLLSQTRNGAGRDQLLSEARTTLSGR